ncbi:Ecp9-1 [Fulvia fulva]|uniref:Ecp9-1 n=1 Tax=Passalora fulva TaxID=5499 RepID=A0A1P8YXH8_PASFU|nr:Ecp9-1 [Fulvia fulva]AQA29212.1 extracellular protein 9-1 [Fulvia fulva]KAK4621743.1 Ecp9-1 [Fulvia fulva]KAK4622529.1 Ecp9-1 [Fulvia fulva]UJO19012.1 Ecp9-1 [Fulvia fulva]WPV16181.1 Ecp9-1 [Fulvia fulva]
MNLLSILLACMSTVVLANDHHPPVWQYRWCNYGAEGDGGCEAKGLNTYCCSQGQVQTNAFPVKRLTTAERNGPNQQPECIPYGLRFCA